MQNYPEIRKINIDALQLMSLFILVMAVVLSGCNKQNCKNFSENLSKAVDQSEYRLKDYPVASLTDTMFLSDLLTSDKLLICLSDLGCRSCSEREIKILDTFMDSVAKNNVVILAQFRSRREHFLFERDSGLKAYRRLSSVALIDRYKNESVMFIATPDLMGRLILNLKEYPELSKEYYKNFFAEKFLSSDYLDSNSMH